MLRGSCQESHVLSCGKLSVNIVRNGKWECKGKRHEGLSRWGTAIVQETENFIGH